MTDAVPFMPDFKVAPTDSVMIEIMQILCMYNALLI
jgi:hypothetical protein